MLGAAEVCVHELAVDAGMDCIRVLVGGLELELEHAVTVIEEDF